MRNLAANFGKILDICKKFSKNLVDERGNMPLRGGGVSLTLKLSHLALLRNLVWIASLIYSLC